MGEGIVSIYSGHITLGIAVQEDEPLLVQDMERWLGGLVRDNPDDPWLHNCLHMRPG